MKKLTITALLIVSLFTVTPAAQAADWSNGKFSCDLEVTKLAPWWEFYNWGKWEELHLKYSLISRPGISGTFVCDASSLGYTEFLCRIVQPEFSKALFVSNIVNKYTFNPGTSKSQACEALFNGYGIKER